MTLREFKAWLDGYEASFGYSGPSTTQWEKVKEKLETVNDWTGLKLPDGMEIKTTPVSVWRSSGSGCVPRHGDIT